MTVLPDTLTPVTAPDLAAALQAEGVPELAVRVLIAHSALESGWWQKCHCFNLGNRKAAEAEPHTFYECGEELPHAQALALEHESPSIVFVVREYRGNDGRDMASCVFKPEHPMCRFAAFECLEAGARDYVGLLRGRFPEAYAAAELGDGTAFVKALKARGYFTATLGQYLATFIGVLKMVDDRLKTDPSPPPSETQPAVAVSPDVFTFSLLPGESVRDRIVRCCDEAAQFGPMGDALLRPRYASFVACGLAGWDYDALPTVRTSCAIVQGSVDRWCHRPGAGSGSRRGLVGGGMFHGWLGDLSYQHPAWRPAVHGFPVVGDPGPRPGDLFYVAVNATSNNNHVGRFLRETSPGVWETFEGGGGDGTRTGKSSRTLGPHFDAYGRVLLGWWDADLMGYFGEVVRDVPLHEAF